MQSHRSSADPLQHGLQLVLQLVSGSGLASVCAQQPGSHLEWPCVSTCCAVRMQSCRLGATLPLTASFGCLTAGCVGYLHTCWTTVTSSHPIGAGLCPAIERLPLMSCIWHRWFRRLKRPLSLNKPCMCCLQCGEAIPEASHSRWATHRGAAAPAGDAGRGVSTSLFNLQAHSNRLAQACSLQISYA